MSTAAELEAKSSQNGTEYTGRVETDVRFSFIVPDQDDPGFTAFIRRTAKIDKAFQKKKTADFIIYLEELLELFMIPNQGDTLDDILDNMKFDDYLRLYQTITEAVAKKNQSSTKTSES